MTDTSHTKARILDVRADRIREALDQDLIVLVAGFQGVSTARDVTTLGRGGSDTTAVALAAAMDAEVCEIYTDVAGVFSADPRIVPDARKLPVVSFEEMLEMSASGAGVLQLRSVEYARNHGVRIHCRSSFTEAPGTFVVGEEETMERPLITAVTHSRDEARLTLLGVPDHPGVAGRIFTALADANINVDMIIQDEPDDEGAEAHMSFTVPRTDLRDARAALDPVDRRGRHPRDLRGPRDGQGLGRRRGHEVPPRRRRARLHDARRPGHQHRDDLDVPDQDLVRRHRRLGGPRRARAARGVRARRRPDRGRAPVWSTRMSQYKVAVVGATGAVGTVMRAKLKERGFPADEIVPFASERSEGARARRRAVPRRSATSRSRASTSRCSARARRPRARGRRSSSTPARSWSTTRARSARDPEIPLVVSEVNPDALEGHQGLIANPNCSTMQLMVALKPIHDAAGIDRLIVSTYQSVSGTGVKAVKELEDQTRAALAGEPLPDPTIYPHHIAFNVLGGAGNFADGDDHTDEERKMMFETRKILGDESIKIAVTCARVPVRNCALGVGHARDPRRPVGRGRARAARGACRA